MKVVILGAGQGKRLLPLTAEVPKALLDIGGMTLVARQVAAFAGCGLKEFVVITGYGTELMEQALADLAKANDLTIRTVYNPFYSVADNLASCWMARDEMDGPFIQVNGDNVFGKELVKTLLDASSGPLTVAINHKDSYDGDDMKVMMDGERLTEIGKTLPVEAVDAEAIGLYVFDAEGAAAYREVLNEAMRDQSGLKQWFPAAIGTLAKRIHVRTGDISAHEWGEVDFPVDLQSVRHMVSDWD